MNKRIVKNITLSVLLTVFICVSVLSLGGCYRGPLFNREHLQEHLVPDLPQPRTFMGIYHGDDIKVRMTQEKFDKYVVSVYEYLLSCNFAKFGTRGEDNSTMFGMRHYVNEDVSELSDFYIKRYAGSSADDSYLYVFVWANETSELSGSYGSWIAHYLELYYNTDEGKMHMQLCYRIAPYSFKD